MALSNEQCETLMQAWQDGGFEFTIALSVSKCSECKGQVAELDPVAMKPCPDWCPSPKSQILSITVLLCVACVQKHLRGVLEGDGGQ